MGQIISARTVQEKSRQLHIPYQHLLIGCAKEWILDQLLSKLTSYNLFVKRSFQLGLDAYRHGSPRQLYISLTAEELLKDQVEEILAKCFENVSYIVDEINQKDETYRNYRITIDVPFDKLTVPITVNLESMTEMKAQKVVYPLELLYEDARTIEITCYYPEMELAELFADAYDRMELMMDMAALDSIYYYSTTNKFDGRYLMMNIVSVMEKQGMKLSYETLELLYRSMQSKSIASRFKGYLRSQKRTEPKYTQVYDCFYKIYDPICTTILRDEIFLGDWMPEVGRYL